MSDPLAIERCPETGICSIARSSAAKLDLMPDEVETIRDSGGDAAAIRAVLTDSDRAFAATLSDTELGEIWQRLS